MLGISTFETPYYQNTVSYSDFW